MHPEAKSAWSEAITATLDRLRAVQVTEVRRVFVWQHAEAGGWLGHEDAEPDPTTVILSSGVIAQGKDLDRVMRQHHPAYCGLVGTRTVGLLGVDMGHRLLSATWELWKRHRTFEISIDDVAALVEDVAAFIDSESIAYRFIVPIIKFHMDRSLAPLEVLPGVELQQLTEREVSEIYGNSYVPGTRSSQFGPLDFAFVGTYEEPKLFGEGALRDSTVNDPIRSTLDPAVLALRTFKKGSVGLDYAWIKPVRFSPFSSVLSSRGYGSEYIPFGRYELVGEEIQLFQRHAEYFRGQFHASLRTACSRLGAAEIRIDPREKLFDAAVGLEAILLTEMPDTYRGEPTYRFATNLAALEDTPERRSAMYRIGKDLYALRSAVAHGGEIEGESVRYGEDRIALAEAAQRSCELLRTVVQRFLPQASAPDYTSEGYWPRRLFSPP